jgi:hypothetical protein
MIWWWGCHETTETTCCCCWCCFVTAEVHVTCQECSVYSAHNRTCSTVSYSAFQSCWFLFLHKLQDVIGEITNCCVFKKRKINIQHYWSLDFVRHCTNYHFANKIYYLHNQETSVNYIRYIFGTPHN